MNRGYTAYLKESKTAVKKTLKNKGNLLKLFAWGLLSILGKLLILPAALMEHSEIGIAKNCAEDKEVKIFESFDQSSKAKSFWALTVANFIKIGLFLTSIIVISLLGMLVYAFINFILNVFMSEFCYNNYILVEIISALPMIVALLFFIVKYTLRLFPTKYVSYANPDASSSEILSVSNKTMSDGKFVVFLNALRFFFFIALRFIIFYAIIYIYEWLIIFLFGYPITINICYDWLLGELLYNLFGLTYGLIEINNDFMLYVYVFTYVIKFSLLLYFIYLMFKGIAKCYLINSVSNLLLVEDLTSDKYNINKKAKGVYIKNSKGKLVKKVAIADIFGTAKDCNASVPKQDNNGITPEKAPIVDYSETDVSLATVKPEIVDNNQEGETGISDNQPAPTTSEQSASQGGQQ